MKTRLFAIAALALALAACNNDDPSSPAGGVEGAPVIIQASGLTAVATPASRATVDGDWQGVQTVALKMGDAVKEYTVTASDADGYRSATLSNAADPFYWTSRDPITVSAWWPLDDTDITQMPDVQVAADQSKLADFQNSDFISAIDQTVTYDKPTLTFTHRTARVTVSLQAGNGIASVAGAKVSLVNLSTLYGNPATIYTYHPGGTYEALVLPQTVAAGKPFIRVELGNGTFSFLPQSNIKLEAGSSYRYIVSVNATGLTLEGSTIGDWKPGNGESGEAVEDLGYTTTTDDQSNVTGYNVYNADGLQAWADAVRSGGWRLNCTLTADITLPEVAADQSNWTPIGTDSSNAYTGTFDGGGKTITGLTVTTDGENAGLFGYIGRGGTVKDVTLEGVQITTTHSMGNAGGVAGQCSGTLENCFVSGDVSGYYAGGVAGYLFGSSLTGCGSSATVVGTYDAGGVAGDINGNNNTLTACYATGDVSGTKYGGGVVGYNDSGTLIACYHATGTVNGQDGTGGVAGYNFGTLTACYWSDSPDTGIGIDQVGTDEATQVDGTDVTWQTAIAQMNTALSGTGWEYIPGDNDLPELQKKQ
ncbi:fimbrillin family protein [uncultured Bacteroides sp.]|uniref:fimbrillin family protein n=1 Tax=uncultured Bacteroides sp. TaxID=162156 RepID=UPI002624A4C5|nr:fimbrillin family protein [uncultured Bacteroides sp.]